MGDRLIPQHVLDIRSHLRTRGVLYKTWFDGLTRGDGDVAASPELLRVRLALATDGRQVGLDPLVGGGRALAVPAGGVEVVVPDVLAPVAGHC